MGQQPRGRGQGGNESLWKKLCATGSECMFLKLGEHFNGGRGELFHLKGMTPWGQKSREGLMAPTRSNSPIWYFSENIAKSH